MMKKISILLSLVMMLLLGSNAFAHQGVQLKGFSLGDNGLSFSSIVISMEVKNRVGSIIFNSSKPEVTPVEKNSLAPSNTVAAFKAALVESINNKITADPLNNYKPIVASDISIYGGYSVQTENEFTDSRVLSASKAGAHYRVKVVLTPMDETQTITTAIQGLFTIYAK